MVWVAWRQHRAELLAFALLLGVAAIPYVVSGVTMHAAYHADGVAACVADPARAGCGELAERFSAQWIDWSNRMLWVAFVPGVIGVFAGAPLLAREFEAGTWRLAFTQSVTRTRWLVSKLLVAGLGAAVLALLLGVLLQWWRGPINAISGPLRSTAFITAAPSLVAATVFAFALGVFAGALVRRTIPAMGLTLLVFVAVRIPMEEELRPRYLTPLVRVTAEKEEWRPNTGWVVGDGWIDSAGQRLTQGQEAALMRDAQVSDVPVSEYIADLGLRHYVEYHPNSVLAAMWLIEAGIFAGAAAILLATAFWLVRRRTV